MFWCEHFEEDFKCRPIFKEVNKATLFPKGQVGLIMQQVVPSLTVLEKRRIFIPPMRARPFKAEREPADCKPKVDKKIT